MTSQQYEELCRRFLAEQQGIVVDAIVSIRVPNPQRPNLPKYKHQIDLYWEVSNQVALYLNIANAKWRTSDKVDQPEVLLLQKVKEKVAAHKALMITNNGFTSGAVAAAKDEGIGLHIVQPEFDVTSLDPKDVSVIQAQLESISSSDSRQALYSHEIVCRAFEPESMQAENGPSPSADPSGEPQSNRMATGYSHRAATAPSNTSLGPGGGGTGGSAGPGYSTRQGGSGFRTK